MNMSELFSAISNFGFPIALTAYLLVRFEKKLESLSNNIEQNTRITERLAQMIEQFSEIMKERHGKR